MSYYKDSINFGHEEAGRAIGTSRRTPGGLRQNMLHEDELIAQCNEAFDDSAMDLMHACETFYMNGCADAVDGDVESDTGHFYRVHRWIVTTDNYGFKEIETYDTETEAIVAFEQRADEHTQWAGEDQ
jgi:hypothetical protein